MEIISARAKKVELFIYSDFIADDSVEVRECPHSITDSLTMQVNTLDQAEFMKLLKVF